MLSYHTYSFRTENITKTEETDFKGNQFSFHARLATEMNPEEKLFLFLLTFLGFCCQANAGKTYY